MRDSSPKGIGHPEQGILTVNGVSGDRFDINIIPHTQERTTFGEMKVGDPVNMEIDILARYVARLADTRGLSGA